jgi:hypothetical protein
MCGNSDIIQIPFAGGYLDMAGGLGGIYQDPGPSFVRPRCQFFEGINRPDFIIRGHRADEVDSATQGGVETAQTQVRFAVDLYPSNFCKSVANGNLQRVENCSVFDARRGHPDPGLGAGGKCMSDRQTNGFRRSGGKVNAVSFCSQQVGDRAARSFYLCESLLSEVMVDTAGVAEIDRHPVVDDFGKARFDLRRLILTFAVVIREVTGRVAGQSGPQADFARSHQCEVPSGLLIGVDRKSSARSQWRD